LNFEPGTAFGYSGEAFNYLGRVVEHITGKDLQTLYEQEVARPFKVKDSYFFYTDEQENRFALGHMQQYPQVKEKERVVSPASGMSTNAHLFKSFVLGLINERGLSKSSYQLIYDPYTELTQEQKLYDPEVPQHVSHGFFVQRTPFGELIAHGGNNGDYDCKFIYSPEQKFGFIVFTNSNLGDEFTRAFEEFLLPK
ncbi:MAG: serine hydrolase domain-containing protein, partial [Bacteroidota bacterium]